MKLFESKIQKRLTEATKDKFKSKYLEGLKDMWDIKPTDKLDDGFTVAEAVTTVADFVLDKIEDFEGLHIDDAVLYLNRIIKKKDSGAVPKEAQLLVKTVADLTGAKPKMTLK